MMRIHRLPWGWLAAGLMLWTGAAEGAVYSANVTNGSTSTPKLNAAGTAWEPFSNAQATPNAGKSIKILYLPDDGVTFTGFPLNVGGATVQLRASTGGAMVNCTFNAAAPVFSAASAGTCTYRTISTGGQAGDTIEIFYLGLLSGNIRYTVAGVTPAVVAGNSVANFDSDTVLAGTPPAPATGPPLSRKSARLVLVFDKSGSMDWSAKPADAACGPYYTPTPACKRWEILKIASAHMVSVAKAYTLPGDELGVAFFDTGASDTGGIAAMTNVTLDAVATALTARSPGGSTSIGAGVERLKAGQLVNNANFNNMTLLFTDGEQNTAPFLVSDGAQLLINQTQNQPFGTAWVPAGNSISLCTFRLRTDDPAGPAGTTTLQQIADRGCAGLMNSAATLDALPTELILYFLQVLHATLIGDKLEIVQVRQGTVPPPTTTQSPLQLQFTTSRRDLSFTTLLSWDAGFQVEGRPALRLRKDGVEFNVLQDPNVLVIGTGRHVALTLRAPFCNAAHQCVSPEGVWTLEAMRLQPRGAGTWALFVLADNQTLSSSYTVTQTTAGIGQPLQFRASLTEGGAPLAGLAAGSVRAFVQAPSQGLGNILAASVAKPGDPPPTDPNTLAGRKAQAMLADPAERAKLLAALELGAEQGIPLTESSPGVYTGSFPATLVEGIYRVTYRVEGASPGNAAFTRVFKTDRYVPVQPDDAATAKTMQIAPAVPCDPRFVGGCKRITLRPVDAAGNFVGPGKATSFAVGAGAELVGTIDDRLDGSYVIVIGYPQPGTTPPQLSIGGLTLNLPQAAGPEKAGGLWRWWWIILLILLVILIVIWLLRRP